MYGCCATGRVSMVGRNLSHKNIGKNCQKNVKKMYMKVSIFYRLCTTNLFRIRSIKKFCIKFFSSYFCINPYVQIEEKLMNHITNYVILEFFFKK